MEICLFLMLEFGLCYYFIVLVMNNVGLYISFLLNGLVVDENELSFGVVFNILL